MREAGKERVFQAEGTCGGRLGNTTEIQTFKEMKGCLGLGQMGWNGGPGRKMDRPEKQKAEYKLLVEFCSNPITVRGQGSF